MIMGGNQPYFMPYIGYWQLINAVDIFFIGDDYNYIDKGWVKRNRILENGEAKYFNLEIYHGSSNKKINELFLSESFKPEKRLLQLRHAYRKAPYFEQGYELMQKILEYNNKNLADFLEYSIRCVCEYLEIKTKIMRTSTVPLNAELKKEYRIFDLCKYVGADVYINAIGGQKLYSYEQFWEQGIKLGLIKTGKIQYKQFDSDFIPNLSIIDVIMFNSKEEIQRMLNEYTVMWEEGNI